MNVNVVQANCRNKLSSADMDFICQVTGTEKRSSQSMIALLSDPDSRDKILDDPRLLRAVLEWKIGLFISQQLYFYVLVRNVFRQSGIESRELADYVASLLAEFSVGFRVYKPENKGQAYYYLIDILKELQEADPEREFILRTHLGNYSLFLAGLFYRNIVSRSEKKGAPDVHYYENLGAENFRNAAGKQIAELLELNDIFLDLSDSFHDARLALNEMSDRLVFLKELEPSVVELFENLDQH